MGVCDSFRECMHACLVRDYECACVRVYVGLGSYRTPLYAALRLSHIV